MLRRSWIPLSLLAATFVGATAAQAGAPRPTTTPVTPKPTTNTPTGLISAGTPGQAPPTPKQITGPITVALVGQLAPELPDARSTLLRSNALKQLQLLRPDLVLTLGNLVPGDPKPETYAAQIAAQRIAFDALPCPWYPLIGQTDIIPAQPNPQPNQPTPFQKLQAPAYYSIDTGDLHAIMLDTEEDAGISPKQLSWLRDDLNRTFEGTLPNRRAHWVIVLAHRPLWTLPKSPEKDSWDRVHEMLVSFNRKPVVSVEGAGGSNGKTARAPRAVAVIASGRAYSQEPPHDEIRYYIAPPCAAAPALDETTALRALMILRFETDKADGMNVALLNLNTNNIPGAFLPDSIITAQGRAALDAIARWKTDGPVQCEGTIDLRRDPPTKLVHVHMTNPLKDPIDVSVQTANTWQIETPAAPHHLKPAANETWDLSLSPTENAETPPRLQCVITWHDPDHPENPTIPITIERRIPVATRIDLPYLPTQEKIDPKNPIPPSAPLHPITNWQPRADESPIPTPTWQISTDATTIYLRVHITGTPPTEKLHDKDEITLQWTPSPKQPPHHLNIKPFSTTTPVQIDDKPTPTIHATIDSNPKGYAITIPIPRETLFPIPTATHDQSAFINLAISTLAESTPQPNPQPQSQTSSISPPNSQPETWTELHLLTAPAPPALPPAPPPLAPPTSDPHP